MVFHSADGFIDYFHSVARERWWYWWRKHQVIECETAYNTEKGVECYEATKGEGVLSYSPLSTGITYQLIPKVTADGIALHTMGYGRTSAKNGQILEMCSTSLLTIGMVRQLASSICWISTVAI
jgi:branched-chain amino acid transport system substrate-binding protein